MNKDEMLEYLSSWCDSQITRNGKVRAICFHLPYKHRLNDSWCRFWFQVDKAKIESIEHCFLFIDSRNDRNAMMSITRMLLLHDFVNWLYD